MALSASATVEVGFNDEFTEPSREAFEWFKENASNAVAEFTGLVGVRQEKR